MVIPARGTQGNFVTVMITHATIMITSSVEGLSEECAVVGGVPVIEATVDLHVNVRLEQMGVWLVMGLVSKTGPYNDKLPTLLILN